MLSFVLWMSDRKPKHTYPTGSSSEHRGLSLVRHIYFVSFAWCSFMSSCYKLELSESKKPRLRRCLHKNHRAFSYLVIARWCHGDPGLSKEAGWAMWSKPKSSILHGLCISSCSRFLPCLNSYPDFHKWWATVGKWKSNKPFPPQLAFGHGVSSQQWKFYLEHMRRLFLW